MGQNPPKGLAEAHQRLLDEIEQDARETAALTGRASYAARVMDALARVPRDQFLDPADSTVAYANRPHAIGHGQTISQPYIVAVMTDLLDLTPTDRVLEIGTGSGYQTAVLSLLADEIYSVEIIPALAETAKARLQRLGFNNIHLRIGDGREGWPATAPYDAIIVTAVAEEAPPRLLDQLAPGGRMIIPVGETAGAQQLILINKDNAGGLHRRNILPVAFVPLVRGSSQ